MDRSKYSDLVVKADAWWLTLSIVEKQSVIGASFAIEKKMKDDELGDIFEFLDNAKKWFDSLPRKEQRARIAYAYCEANDISPIDGVDWLG